MSGTATDAVAASVTASASAASASVSASASPSAAPEPEQSLLVFWKNALSFPFGGLKSQVEEATHTLWKQVYYSQYLCVVPEFVDLVGTSR